MVPLVLLLLSGCGGAGPCGAWSLPGSDAVLVLASPDGTTTSERWAEPGAFEGDEAWVLRGEDHTERTDYWSETTWSGFYRCDAEGMWNLHQSWSVQGETQGDPFEGTGATWYDEPVLTRPLRLEADTSWQVQATWTTEVDGATGQPVTASWTVEVVELGDVELPAGTFEGAHLERDQDGSTSRWWLARGLGLVQAPGLELVEVR